MGKKVIPLLLPHIVALKREQQFMQHVYKCFTFGYPVRRIDPLIPMTSSKIEELKRAFNRVALIRGFFSIQRKNMKRKFKFPLDWFGNVVKKTKEPDYVQYCCESDLEHEYARRTKE